MKRLGWMMVVVLGAFAACSESHDRVPGSQTHFLQACDGSCAAPYDCICGVCTLVCSKDSQCSAHASEATCSLATGADTQCGSGTPVAVCDVECHVDGDCGALGAGYACAAGHCRLASASIDAGPSTIDGGSNPNNAMCDGGDGVRLYMTTGGGLVGPDWGFSHPYGERFAFVDGKCRFYVSTNAMVGIATGVLDSADADQLVRDIRWEDIPTFGWMDQGCADGPSTSIDNGLARASCSCDCEPGAPAGKPEAEAAARMWIERMSNAGQLLTSEVRAAARAYTDTPPASILPWPLSSPIGDIAVKGNLLVNGGMLFDSGDATKLRALRAQALAMMMSAQSMYVSDGAQTYVLYVRDELPVVLEADNFLNQRN